MNEEKDYLADENLEKELGDLELDFDEDGEPINEAPISKEKKALYQKICAYAQSNDPELRQQAFTIVYEETQAYIKKLINEHYRGQGRTWVVDKEDAFQSCLQKIFERLDTFDPDRGSLTTFIHYKVKSELNQIKALNTNISQHYQIVLNQIAKVENSFRELGREATFTDIAIELSGVSRKTIRDALFIREEADSMSLDSTTYEFLDNSYYSDRNMYCKSPDAILIANESQEYLQALAKLPELERTVFEMKVFSNGESASYVSIAKQLDMTIEAVKKLYTQAQKKLREDKYFIRKNAKLSNKEYKALNSEAIPLIPTDIGKNTLDVLEGLDNMLDEVYV